MARRPLRFARRFLAVTVGASAVTWFFVGATARRVASDAAVSAVSPPSPGGVSPYDPTYTPTPASPAPQNLTLKVRCDDPLETRPDCDAKARAACHGPFKIIEITEAENPPAGPWRLGRDATRDYYSPEDADEPGTFHGVRRTLSFVCGR
jgi:hypothetical protein